MFFLFLLPTSHSEVELPEKEDVSHNTSFTCSPANTEGMVKFVTSVFASFAYLHSRVCPFLSVCMCAHGVMESVAGCV